MPRHCDDVSLVDIALALEVLNSYLIHIYVFNRSNPKLPFGEDIDVKMGYNGLLQHSTTSDLSAEDCKDLGMSLVRELYPKVCSKYI